MLAILKTTKLDSIYFQNPLHLLPPAIVLVSTANLLFFAVYVWLIDYHPVHDHSGRSKPYSFRPFGTQPISSVILPPPPPPPPGVLPSRRVKLCSLSFICYRCATGGPDSSLPGVTPPHSELSRTDSWPPPPPTSPDFTAARIKLHRALLWQNGALGRTSTDQYRTTARTAAAKARTEMKIREAVPALLF